MKRFILEPWKLALVLILTFACVGVQSCVDYGRRSSTVIASKVSCAVTGSWYPTGFWDTNRIHLSLDCQGQKMTSVDEKVIASYIRNPGPLTCTINKAGDPKCEPRK